MIVEVDVFVKIGSSTCQMCPELVVCYGEKAYQINIRQGYKSRTIFFFLIEVRPLL